MTSRRRIRSACHRSASIDRSGPISVAGACQAEVIDPGRRHSS